MLVAHPAAVAADAEAGDDEGGDDPGVTGWAAEFAVDLARSREAQQPVLSLRQLGPLA